MVVFYGLHNYIKNEKLRIQFDLNIYLLLKMHTRNVQQQNKKKSKTSEA